ncbi:hypothetical protein [Pleionea mediterranea]|uniref:Uncharacterized protein n=1 Tax=Pleionea mediterranea TaxID=523701 RepID=A0A316FZ51_9GAMM|nr:hypothetical protein [Pleionea mediterranea]PWK52820.1 hypothetical protein C8D97_10438 [Pleionea mediterranea]
MKILFILVVFSVSLHAAKSTSETINHLPHGVLVNQPILSWESTITNVTSWDIELREGNKGKADFTYSTNSPDRMFEIPLTLSNKEYSWRVKSSDNNKYSNWQSFQITPSAEAPSSNRFLLKPESREYEYEHAILMADISEADTVIIRTFDGNTVIEKSLSSIGGLQELINSNQYGSRYILYASRNGVSINLKIGESLPPEPPHITSQSISKGLARIDSVTSSMTNNTRLGNTNQIRGRLVNASLNVFPAIGSGDFSLFDGDSSDGKYESCTIDNKFILANITYFRSVYSIDLITPFHSTSEQTVEVNERSDISYMKTTDYCLVEGESVRIDLTAAFKRIDVYLNSEDDNDPLHQSFILESSDRSVVITDLPRGYHGLNIYYTHLNGEQGKVNFDVIVNSKEELMKIFEKQLYAFFYEINEDNKDNINNQYTEAGFTYTETVAKSSRTEFDKFSTEEFSKFVLSIIKIDFKFISSELMIANVIYKTEAGNKAFPVKMIKRKGKHWAISGI